MSMRRTMVVDPFPRPRKKKGKSVPVLATPSKPYRDEAPLIAPGVADRQREQSVNQLVAVVVSHAHVERTYEAKVNDRLFGSSSESAAFTQSRCKCVRRRLKQCFCRRLKLKVARRSELSRAQPRRGGQGLKTNRLPSKNKLVVKVASDGLPGG